jgi:hypothetical protein
VEGALPDHEQLRTVYPAMGGRSSISATSINAGALRFSVTPWRSNCSARQTRSAKPSRGQPAVHSCRCAQAQIQTGSNNARHVSVVIPASTFRTIYGNRYVSHRLIRAADIKRAEYVKHRIYEILGAKYKFAAADERALSMWDFVEDAKMTRAITAASRSSNRIVAI